MNVWSFFNTETGELSHRRYVGPEEFLSQNTPSGMTPIAGAFDHMSQRVNVLTGEIEDWQPPAPQDNELEVYRWSVERKRWVSEPTLKAKKAKRRAEVQEEIEAIEAGQSRALRESLLLSGGDRDAAVAKLSKIDQRIASRRAKIQRIEAASDDDELTAVINSPSGEDDA